MRQLYAASVAMCALASVPAGSAADWTRQFGSPASDTVNAVAVDGTEVYAAGYTFGVLPGQTRAGGIIDAFVVKYDANGNNLTLWPAGTPRPLVSTLNSLLGRVAANAALVPFGNNGTVSVFVTNETHVILDINGYFQ
ncbi:MAG: hypothetical protein IT165_34860 [Bryobacterales bacterium]|nr:hypothetical protein [Bryobacterales bacterium]